MTINNKEIEALHAAIDYITTDADGADADKYPHDIIEGLNSIIVKKDKERYNYLLSKELSKYGIKKSKLKK